MECDSRLNNWAYNNDMNSIGINSFLKDTKRIVSSLLVFFSAICANAQIYSDFGCKD